MLSRTLRDTPGPLLAASALAFATAYFPLRFPDAPGSEAGSYAATSLIALPALVALFRYLGTRRAVSVLLALAAFAYAIETVGVVTGYPYGSFRYGDALGPKAFGIVPYLLPVSYVPLVIGAVAAAWSRRSRARHVLGAVLLLILVDGVLDPGAVALGFWDWSDGGPYYGVPLSNYLGWALSGLLAVAILISAGRWGSPPRPGLLDSLIIAVAFWTGVAVFSLLLFPALLGTALFGYLVLRRGRFSGAGGYKLGAG